MRLLVRALVYALLLAALPIKGQAQELNARVSIETRALGAVDQAQYDDLRQRLTDLINLTRWTNTTMSQTEKIECSFTISLLSQNNDNYTAELNVTARRPVYNASYTTPTFLYRDQDLNFTYRQYDPIEWNPSNIESNLVASVVFYVYAILTFDFDSFAPLGGNPYRAQMRQIVSACQSKSEWKGWKAFESDKNRYALSEALNDPAHEAFRIAWYTYHRRGLDEMVANANRGRSNLLEIIPALSELYKIKSMSPLIAIFATIKLDELVQVLSKGTEEERQNTAKTLSLVFPTETDRINRLKQPAR